MQHSDITSTPNASNCTKAAINQSGPSTSVRNDTSHHVHQVHPSTSTHASTSSSVASPSDVTSTKWRYDTVFPIL
jgi:hypothetical protein